MLFVAVVLGIVVRKGRMFERSATRFPGLFEATRTARPMVHVEV